MGALGDQLKGIRKLLKFSYFILDHIQYNTNIHFVKLKMFFISFVRALLRTILESIVDLTFDMSKISFLS